MWQRARLMGTVEDLFPQAFVLPYLIPMLENAGAYVLVPRERDLNTTEIIVDFDGGLAQASYSETNGSQKWSQAQGKTGFAYTKEELTNWDNPFRMGTVREIKTVTDRNHKSTAQWYADFPKAGSYAVYISYVSTPESAKDARYTVNSLSGSQEFEVNQSIGGGTWIYLGTFPFAAGKSDTPVVELSNLSAHTGKLITADAVKIGGGMGNVSRSAPGGDASVSGYPRFTEGARYWMQWPVYRAASTVCRMAPMIMRMISKDEACGSTISQEAQAPCPDRKDSEYLLTYRSHSIPTPALPTVQIQQ